ncbi:hypothetical protein B0H63DRAFT_464268 [Podospora didyma]|uniref:Uncharacterized protein n=1 Tax=Podospora didyma TaxID=330526 RepID=A0AAE0U402_9PEZI|nr:hypothetical protein B0H63DRAFT_464268 [Podospora didyma]
MLARFILSALATFAAVNASPLASRLPQDGAVVSRGNSAQVARDTLSVAGSLDGTLDVTTPDNEPQDEVDLVSTVSGLITVVLDTGDTVVDDVTGLAGLNGA